MPGANELSTSIRIALRAVLPLGVQVDIEPDSTKAVPTFNVFIRAGGGLHRFLAGWAGEGWPADVERLIAAAPQIEIVFGKRISQGAKEWLLTRHLGWVDESGDANVNLGTGLIILRGGRERLLYEERTVRWTQTMIAAAEAVFVGVPPTVEAVEQATGISRGASNNALAKLEQPHQFLSLPFCRNLPSLSCTLMTTSSRTMIYLRRQSAGTSWIADTSWKFEPSRQD